MDYELLIQKYLENRINNKQKASKILDEMIKMEEADCSLTGRHYFYQAQFAYESGNISEAMRYALDGIESMIKYPYLSELSKCYNVIGIIYNSKGDSMQALDYYLDALELAEDNKDVKTIGSIYNNIGCLYDDLEDADKAIEFFGKALTAFENINEEIYTLIAINLALMYSEIENWGMMHYYYRLATNALLDPDAKNDNIQLALIECHIAYHEDDIEQVKKYLNQVREICERRDLDANGFNEILTALPKLVNINLKDEILSILNLLSAKSDLNRVLDAKSIMLEVSIELFSLLKDEAKVMECMKLYYQVVKDRKKEHANTMIEGMNLKIQMRKMLHEHQEVEKQSQIYRYRAQRDDLTGLFNRSILKDELEPKFEQAGKLNKQIGIAIVDINDFKQYNDFYGHVAGDRCIHELASVMLRLNDDNIRFIRYGGDEFLGFFYDLDEGRIRNIMQTILIEIRSMNIEHANSTMNEKVVSVTAGVYISVPKCNDTLNDFIELADSQLYKGKRDSKVMEIEAK